MRAGLAATSLILGAVYTSYGVITIVDLVRGWRQFGLSHFGLAWIAMAFTCGPHHLEHGIHLALGPRPAGALELVSVIVGIPAGVAWFLLRVEAVFGGRGDRVIGGDARWPGRLPTVGAVWAIVFAVGAAGVLLDGGTLRPTASPNLLLVVLYGMIGWYLFRAQLENHAALGAWSLSGVALTVVFPTCALMHGAWVVYQLHGDYTMDVHSLIIDWMAVPAAFYFLWVVRGLQRGVMRDWNEATTGVTAELVDAR